MRGGQFENRLSEALRRISDAGAMCGLGSLGQVFGPHEHLAEFGSQSVGRKRHLWKNNGRADIAKNFRVGSLILVDRARQSGTRIEGLPITASSATVEAPDLATTSVLPRCAGAGP